MKRGLSLTALAAVLFALLPQGVVAADHPGRNHRFVPLPPVRPAAVPLRGVGQRSKLQIFRSDDPAPSRPVLSLREQRATVSTVVGGAWTPLGPRPITGEKSLCMVPPSSSVCGTYGNSTGRITSLVADPTNALTAYAGAAGGGVWKTTNGGNSWSPLTDGQASLAVGALAISSDGQTIYAGTGEINGSDSQLGQGVLISTNGGTGWTLSGQTEFGGHHIGGIAIDRTNTMHVLVAGDMGLFVTSNAGGTWTDLTSVVVPAINNFGFATPSGALYQVIQDPSDALKFWLSVGDNCQTEIGSILTGDGNMSWTDVSPTSLQQVASRIGLDVGKGGVAYLSAAGCFGNLIALDKTTTGATGLTPWPQIYAADEFSPSPSPNGTPYKVTLAAPGVSNYFNGGAGPVGQGSYDNVVAVDPTDATHVVLGGVTVLTSANGGGAFKDTGVEYTLNAGIVHPDFHAFAFTSHDHFYVGNDGGVYKTADFGGVGAGGDWLNLNNGLDTVQYYNGSALDINHFLGGAQDNGTSGSLIVAGAGPAPRPGPWQLYLDGDGTFTALDPHSTTMYASYPGLGIFKGDTTGAPLSSFGVAAPCTTGSEGACTEPTDFLAPFALDTSAAPQPRPIIAGTNHVWYSTSGGTPGTWSEISPNMTAGLVTCPAGMANDRLQVMAMGSVAGVKGAIITGSRYGKVWWSKNSTIAPVVGDWIDATGNLPAFPCYNVAGGVPTAVEPNGWITGVAINPANTKEAWVTIGGLHVSHVFHTTDAGGGPLHNTPVTWADMNGAGLSGVPDTLVNGVTFDQPSGNLYIGTDSGVMVCSTCSGATPTATWSTFGSLFPGARVNAITVTAGGDVVAWTHGRGAWMIPSAAIPEMFISPPKLNLTCLAGTATSTSQVVTIANKGGGTLNWTLTPPAGVTATLTSGSIVSPASTTSTVSMMACPATTGTSTLSIPASGNGGSLTIAVALTVDAPGQYTAVAPSRILDTRLTHQTLGLNGTLDLPVAGHGGVPLSGATAVVLNVTVTGTTMSSFLTVFPTGAPQPLASNLNWVAGQTIPNLVEVALGAGGSVTIYNLRGSVDVIADVQGYVSSPGGTAGLFNPVVPARIMDTRSGLGGSTTLGPNSTATLAVAGNGGVPMPGATAVALNVTVTGATAGSFLTVYPSDAAQPLASNLNFLAGQTIPNRVIVKLGAGGAIKIYNLRGRVDVIVDVGGWFTDGVAATTGGKFTGLTPHRLLDTRFNTGGYTTPLLPGGTLTLPVAGQGGVPPEDSPTPPTAVVLNVTVTNPTASSFLTVWPSDAAQPLVSDLNFVAGLTVPNLVVVKLSPDGSLNMYGPAGRVDVIADVVGWYG